MYDSTADTTAHIARVQELLFEAMVQLKNRGMVHDASKLEEPEKAKFDEADELKHLTYGTPEYMAGLDRLGVGLKHHYANNSHHPEHYANGIGGMSLLDLIEMLVDWKAASERHANGDMQSSLTKNKERFGIDDQLFSILMNTAAELGLI